MIAKKKPAFIWIICAVLVLLLLVEFGLTYAATFPINSALDNASNILTLVTIIISTVISALIISRQPTNAIGWVLGSWAVLLLLAAPTDQVISRVNAGLNQVTSFTLFAAWISTWNWFLYIGTLLLIPLLFPTGRLLSPRWRWVIASLLVEFIYFIFLASVQANFHVGDSVTFQNPFGWIPDETINLLLLPFPPLLATTAVFCVAAIFIRYRRATGIEREQIKWLFYAFGIFLVLFAANLFFSNWGWVGIVFSFAIMAVPLAIGVSILRYRLWDIDVLIRRTITYGFLTLVLGLSYFGSVILLQGIFERLFGGNSQVVIVFSTLLIAALFNPLRIRIQAVIDRRFYRQKYDAEQAVASFSSAARSEVDQPALTDRLIEVVSESVQPESISLWLRKESLN